jgi:hypothetical protein
LGVGLPGVLAYGNTPDEVIVKSEALALGALAERNDLRPEYDLYRKKWHSLIGIKTITATSFIWDFILESAWA